MSPLPVFAERLAMIGRDHDEGAIEGVSGAQTIEKGAERLVRVGDFARIRILAVARGKWFRRRIRFVRIVQVDPGKPWLMAQG
jgi:hypothetical protein